MDESKAKQFIAKTKNANRAGHKSVRRQDSLNLRSILVRIVDLKMIFFVDFFIYFINNVAVCKLFTPFMRCESNLKVKVECKQGNLIAYNLPMEPRSSTGGPGVRRVVLVLGRISILI